VQQKKNIIGKLIITEINTEHKAVSFYSMVENVLFNFKLKSSPI